MQVQQHIYLKNYITHSVAVSQRWTGHMQAYKIIMEGN